MAYMDECRNISRGIEQAKEVFSNLLSENLIESSYGSSIQDALHNLEQALDEVGYIEDKPESEEIDVTEIYTDSRRIDDILDDIESKMGDIESKMGDVRDYANNISASTRYYA